MYTIVVADDEEQLRKALIRKVNWESIGFQVVGEAENGIEALELVEKYEPDLLLTDIRMPFVSGIELARQVREVRPATQIAFLSGFDDFSYAKQAIQYNILSYMLKPISALELTEELKQIKNKIDEKYTKFVSVEKQKKDSEILEFIMPLLLDEFQVFGKEGNEKLQQCAIECGMLKSIEHDLYYTVMITTITNHEQKNITGQTSVEAVGSIIEKYVKHVSFYVEGRIVSLLYGTKGALEKYVHIIVEEITQSVTRIMKMISIMGVSRSTKNMTSLHELYVEAMNALSYSERNKNHVCFIRDVERTDEVDFEKVQNFIGEIGKYVRGGSEEELQNCLEEFFRNVEKEHRSITFYHMIFNQIVSEILRIVYVVVKNENAAEFQKLIAMQSMGLQNNSKEIEKGCEKFCLAAKEMVSEQRKKSSTLLCEQAIEIIEKKYMNAEISLVSVSEEIAVSPNYLSSLLKKSTGSTFVDLLSQKRMQVAKEYLLCTSMKIKEISEKCGYKDQHYFSYCFKKYTGMSPNACRRIQ